jgi:nicotinamidase-related amidase
MSKGLKVELLVIDPQNDFCDPAGSLYVPGADKDIERLADMVSRLKPKLHDIHVTLDTHRLVDIAHPIFWVNSDGEHPAPFTIISVDDVSNGTWYSFDPSETTQKRAKEYVENLATNDRYPLCIWPPHCLIGTWGHNVHPDLTVPLLEWEKGYAAVDYVTKGSNPWSEHYSAVQADVPDPEDPSTMLNTQLIQILQEADIIPVAGQAITHCVANTVRDIANNFGEENIKKLVLLEDASSPVPGFEQMGTDFVTEMKARGMQITTTDTFMI